jgi:hypothetical protein
MKAEQFKDSIFLDSKKCNAALVTIHADGRITVAEHLKPTETAAAVLQIMREQWMDGAQATKIRKQEDRIRRLEKAGDPLFENSNPSRWDSPADAARKLTEQSNWIKAKEAKP